MKKVSILALHLGFGGIEKSIVALANLLIKDYKVEISCTYKLYDEPVFDLDPRVKVIYLTEHKPNKEEFLNSLKKKQVIKVVKEGTKSLKILYNRKKSMVNYIKNTNADIIIATRDIFDEWLGEYGRKDTLKIGWEHNHYHDNLKYADTIKRCCYNLDYLVLVSKELESFYKERLKKSRCKCVYIPNIVDSFPKKLSSLENKRLVSVGRLSKEKGYMDLLTIYKSLIKDYPDWRLDIIGDGVCKSELENYVDKNNLTDQVTLHGFRKKDYIDKVLNESSIYLMTSYTESFGIVLIEAMSHGLPCIAFSSAEGAREIIDSGRNGYLIKNRNHEAYIKKIEDLISDVETRKKVGKEARKSVKQFEGSQVIKYWYNILERK